MQLSVRERAPIVHCITNQIFANFQANGLLAVGCSFAGLLYKYTQRRIMAAGSEVIGTGLLASLVELYSPVVLGKRFERHSLSVLPKQ